MSDCSTCGGCSKEEKVVTVESEAIIKVLTNAIEHKLKFNNGHSERVSALAKWYANYLGIDTQMTELISIAGYLHDIGMLGMPDGILTKESELTDDEWLEIEKHPQASFDFLQGHEDLSEVQLIVRDHHECYDGSGYPNGLEAEEIHLGARIIALCEAIDTMAMDQPYQSAMSFDAIEDEVRSESGKQFDPWLTNHVAELIVIGQEMFYNK